MEKLNRSSFISHQIRPNRQGRRDFRSNTGKPHAGERKPNWLRKLRLRYVPRNPRQQSQRRICAEQIRKIDESRRP